MVQPVTYLLVRRMQHLRNSEAGFSLIEALVALAISAALMVLIIDLLTTDTLQTRRFVNRSEQAVQQMQAVRAFRAAAGVAEGIGTDRQAGGLRISQNRLVVINPDGVQTLFEWTGGTGALAYSGDGQVWRATSESVADDAIRFMWREGGAEQVWLEP